MLISKPVAYGYFTDKDKEVGHAEWCVVCEVWHTFDRYGDNLNQNAMNREEADSIMLKEMNKCI